MTSLRDSTVVSTFTESLNTFDVVPSSWFADSGDERGLRREINYGRAQAFVFPSLPLRGDSRSPVFAKIQNFLQGDSGFRAGTFVYVSASNDDRTIQIKTESSGTDLVIDIDSISVSRIHQLDWEEFKELQEQYVRWLSRQICFFGCSSPESTDSLQVFWKDHVLKEASFEQFAARYLNPPAPVTLSAFDTKMFATRILPRQQLSITWGNNNFYPDNTGTGGPATVNASYSRTTSGGNTRLQILEDARGMHLYPPPGCTIADIPRVDPDPPLPEEATLPYSDRLRNLFPKWVMPVYNMFDLHNPYLLTGPARTGLDPTNCHHLARQAPRHLVLLTPAAYVKPDNWLRIGQFETEGGLGSNVDPKDEYKILTRQFVILACDNPLDVASEWKRLLNAGRGKDGERGLCGPYLHGVFAAKTFVELRNRFSLDGRIVEDGVVHFTSVGQALGPLLGSRLNVEAAPGSKPLLRLVRAVPAESARPTRLLLRFYTTMSSILDHAALLEGDDFHAISLPEILR